MSTRVEENFDDVASGFAPVPDGEYICRLDNVQEEASSAGHPMLVWSWVVNEGVYTGKTLRSWTSLLPHALSGAKDHFQAFGAKWKRGETYEQAAARLIGKSATLSVTTREYLDKYGEKARGNSVGAIYPATKAGQNRAVTQTKPLPDDDIPF
jgi:hypothetical protein